MATLRSTIQASIAASYSGTGLAPAIAQLAAQDAISLETGTLSNQGDLLYASTQTLTASSTLNLDLSGSLTDPLGTVIAAVEIVAILIRSLQANTTNLTIGNGTNPFVGPFGAAAHTAQVQPGGVFMAVAPKTGWTVTAATADILRIVNDAGASNTFSVIIIGRSA